MTLKLPLQAVTYIKASLHHLGLTDVYQQKHSRHCVSMTILSHESRHLLLSCELVG